MRRIEDLTLACQKFIQIKSMSGQEQAAAAYIKSLMEQESFDEVQIDCYGSVIGTIHGNQPGKTVLLDGHMDTVGVNAPDQWEHDPFAGEVKDGRIYGRGTSDMKASLIAMLYAATDYARATKRNFPGTLVVASSVHEECFEGVASREISNSVHPDYVVIGEATGGTLKCGQRGRAEVVVETAGISCHSSSPDKGVNAVYSFMEILAEIRNIEPRYDSVLGKTIQELTDIVSAPYPGASVVPSLCRATFDRRTILGETAESVLRDFNDAIKRAQKKDPAILGKSYIAIGEEKCWTGENIHTERFFPAWRLTPEDDIVRKAHKGLLCMGIDAEISYFSFCTNGSHYCGEAGIPTVGYGPSEEALAHVRNEYIEIAEIEKAHRGYYGIIHQLLCG